MQCAGDVTPVTAAPAVGVGYRREIAAQLDEYAGSIDCLEIIAESYLQPTPARLHELDRLRAGFPLITHGLRLSIGSVDRPPASYLRDVARLLDYIDAPYHSDHFAVTSAAGLEFGHLSPLWYTADGLATVIANVSQVQDQLGRQLVLETITETFAIPGATMEMPDFVTEVCATTGCGVLLDLTNVYINAHRAGFDPKTIVDRLPLHAVRQLHLVGYGVDGSGRLVDSHADPVQPELWQLYDYVRSVCSPQVVILERDDDIPALGDLVAELDRARLTPVSVPR